MSVNGQWVGDQQAWKMCDKKDPDVWVTWMEIWVDGKYESIYFFYYMNVNILRNFSLSIVHYLCVLATVEWSAPDYASTWTYSHPLTDQIPIKKHELLLMKSETVCEFRWGFWADSGGWRECIQSIRAIDYVRECPPNLDTHLSEPPSWFFSTFFPIIDMSQAWAVLS